jgi:nucleoid DNA-binding protein
MADTPILSPSRLHRMLPSDLAAIRATIKAPKTAEAILKVFGEYLGMLQEPDAVELDDVSRIAVQLASTGLWEKTSPEVFIESIRQRVDEKVLVRLRDTLEVAPVETERGYALGALSAASKNEMPTLKALTDFLAAQNKLPAQKTEAYIYEFLRDIHQILNKGERVRFGMLRKRPSKAAATAWSLLTATEPSRSVESSTKSGGLNKFARHLAVMHSELTPKAAETILSNFIGTVAERLQNDRSIELVFFKDGVLVVTPTQEGGNRSFDKIEFKSIIAHSVKDHL